MSLVRFQPSPFKERKEKMDALRETKQQIEILLEDLTEDTFIAGYKLGLKVAWGTCSDFVKDLLDTNMDSDQINEKWELSAKWGDKLSEEFFKQDPQKMVDIANKYL